jgi:hypothetical protein
MVGAKNVPGALPSVPGRQTSRINLLRLRWFLPWFQFCAQSVCHGSNSARNGLSAHAMHWNRSISCLIARRIGTPCSSTMLTVQSGFGSDGIGLARLSAPADSAGSATPSATVRIGVGHHNHPVARDKRMAVRCSLSDSQHAAGRFGRCCTSHLRPTPLPGPFEP